MRRLATLFALCVTLATAAALPARADDDEGGKGAPKKCHEVETQVQYRGLAYQHVVVIRNTCDRPLECSVKASSNPETLQVKVAAKSSESVTVHTGSPAREFTADVTCK